MNKYLFTVRLIGYGGNEHDAWRDAVDSFEIETEPIPDDDDTSVEYDVDE